eukprot:scaffold10835_cov153-Skeletonema_menzelii.AAC.5
MTTSFTPMPLLPITSPSTISACRNLSLRPSDIFICSYPKSGTTWTQHIVLTLLLADRKYKAAACTDDDGNSNASDSTDGDIAYNHVSDYAPFFEIDAHWQDTRVLAESVRKNHDRLGRRVFNTHLRWDMLPKKREACNDTQSADGNDKERPHCGKFIYVTRNQIDVVASFYHHLSNQREGTYTDTFETFFQDWMDGKIPFGSSLHHLISFAGAFADNSYDTTSDGNDNTDDSGDSSSTSGGGIDQPLLLLSYEKMKSNLRNEVLRIISFLNLTHIPSHVLEDEILPSFEFSSMKNNIEKFQPKSVGWLNGFQFLRKGVTGDGKKLMLNRSTIDGGDEEKESSELMHAYTDWVEREEYRSKISNVLQDDSNEDCKEVFLSVVGE